MNELKSVIRNDAKRYGESYSLFSLYLKIPGFRYSYWMRRCSYFRKNKKRFFLSFAFARLMLRHYMIKYNIEISDTTSIGDGFYIGHWGCIVINPLSILGRNVDVAQGVILGVSGRGEKRGCPIIGDNVYIGPGAKVIGKIKIGNNVAIGANAVVTKDVPDNAVVAGVPAKIISFEGSEGYCNHRI